MHKNAAERQVKVMVAHPEQQHSYRLAGALEQASMLDSYVTTVYYGKRSLTRLITAALPERWAHKARSRKTDELSEEQIIQLCEGEGLLKLLCQNSSRLRRWYYTVKLHVADRFARKAARLAISRRVDAVVAFDGTSPLLFEILERDAPQIVRILDMSGANLLYTRQIYERDLELQPDYAEMLKKERQVVWNPKRQERSRREIASAQYFLCGSEFVVRSLAFSDVEPSHCELCPYGVDIEQFKYAPHDVPAADKPIRCIFVGGTKEHKGVSYLLQAFEKVGAETAKLTIVGAVTLPAELRTKYQDIVTFVGMLPHDEIPQIMSEHDLLVMPSLSEGFSLTILEAMACGLPVICSQNSGAVGVIEDGVEGYFVPIQDTDALVNRIRWFDANRDLIPVMGASARATAERHTWVHYSQEVADAITRCISG